MRYKLIIAVFAISTIAIIVSNTTHAQPYGTGVYNSNTGYGGETSLSISATSAVNLSVNPSVTGTLGTANGAVTVFSTDATGYKLYIRAVGSTAMTMVGSSIPASTNVTASALTTNTWGYNTSATTDFIGITATDVLLKNAPGTYPAGDITNVVYGLNVDRSKAAGSYVSSIVYTAVPSTN